MNIIYKQVLKIKSTFLKVLIVMLGIFFSIICFCLAIYSLDYFKTENKPYLLIIHILLVFCSYFFFRVLAIVIYSKTYDVKKKILLDIEKGNILTKWLYSKKESDFLKKDYTSLHKGDKKTLYFLLLITAGIPCLIIIITTKSDNLLKSLEMIYLIISSFGIILMSSTDLNNYKRVLKEEIISVIFTKTGYLISNSYVGAFNGIHRRLIDIKYDKVSEKIIFTFSIFSPGIDGDLDKKYTILETFPVPKKYEHEAYKLKQKIPTYNSF